VCRGGETWAHMQAMTVQSGVGPMIAAGIVTQEQVDLMMRLYQDARFYFFGSSTFSAWGKRP
jgi:hypothetical protein